MDVFVVVLEVGIMDGTEEGSVVGVAVCGG